MNAAAANIADLADLVVQHAEPRHMDELDEQCTLWLACRGGSPALTSAVRAWQDARRTGSAHLVAPALRSAAQSVR